MQYFWNSSSESRLQGSIFVFSTLIRRRRSSPRCACDSCLLFLLNVEYGVVCPAFGDVLGRQYCCTFSQHEAGCGLDGGGSV